jgi:hypothetical protein
MNNGIINITVISYQYKTPIRVFNSEIMKTALIYIMLCVPLILCASEERNPCLHRYSRCRDYYSPVCGYSGDGSSITFDNFCKACIEEDVIAWTRGGCDWDFSRIEDVWVNDLSSTATISSDSSVTTNARASGTLTPRAITTVNTSAATTTNFINDIQRAPAPMTVTKVTTTRSHHTDTERHHTATRRHVAHTNRVTTATRGGTAIARLTAIAPSSEGRGHATEREHTGIARIAIPEDTTRREYTGTAALAYSRVVRRHAATRNGHTATRNGHTATRNGHTRRAPVPVSSERRHRGHAATRGEDVNLTREATTPIVRSESTRRAFRVIRRLPPTSVSSEPDVTEYSITTTGGVSSTSVISEEIVSDSRPTEIINQPPTRSYMLPMVTGTTSAASASTVSTTITTPALTDQPQRMTPPRMTHESTRSTTRRSRTANEDPLHTMVSRTRSSTSRHSRHSSSGTRVHPRRTGSHTGTNIQRLDR